MPPNKFSLDWFRTFDKKIVCGDEVRGCEVVKIRPGEQYMLLTLTNSTYSKKIGVSSPLSIRPFGVQEPLVTTSRTSLPVATISPYAETIPSPPVVFSSYAQTIPSSPISPYAQGPSTTEQPPYAQGPSTTEPPPYAQGPSTTEPPPYAQGPSTTEQPPAQFPQPLYTQSSYTLYPITTFFTTAPACYTPLFPSITEQSAGQSYLLPSAAQSIQSLHPATQSILPAEQPSLPTPLTDDARPMDSSPFLQQTSSTSSGQMSTGPAYLLTVEHFPPSTVEHLQLAYSSTAGHLRPPSTAEHPRPAAEHLRLAYPAGSAEHLRLAYPAEHLAYPAGSAEHLRPPSTAERPRSAYSSTAEHLQPAYYSAAEHPRPAYSSAVGSAENYPLDYRRFSQIINLLQGQNRNHM